MKFKNFLIFFILIFISSTLSASYIGFEYTEVRSTSYYTFSNAQFSNYYEPIDLRFSAYSSGFNNYVPVRVTPRVYGVLPNGQLNFVYTLPTSSYLLYPNLPIAYTYNNLFYFDPQYQFYEVKLDIATTDGLYTDTETSYVYFEDNGTSGNSGNSGSTNDPEVIDCSKFALSGFYNIYLEEDEKDTYDLYIYNSVDFPLDVLSVTTNNPSELDVEDITYPYTISSFQTRSAQIDLLADTVSDDYSSFMDIYVTAKYGDLVCEKEFRVDYTIEDKENPSTADCSDIDFENISFEIMEDSSDRFEIDITNDSYDYEFEIESVSINDSENLDGDVSYFPSRLGEDQTKTIKINVDSDEIDSSTTEEIELKVKGVMTRDGREDKTCRVNQDFRFRIIDSENSSGFGECSDIMIYAPQISQIENISEDYSLQDGFYIYNSSNKRFIISNIVIDDRSDDYDISRNPMSYTVAAFSKNSLNFNLRTYDAFNDLYKSKISVYGKFENGASCLYSDISKEFNIYIGQEQDQCSLIRPDSIKVIEGTNTLRVYNNSNHDFIVNDVLKSNLSGLDIEVIDDSFTINKNSYVDFEFGVLGNSGYAELLYKGGFDNGKSCAYSDIQKSVLKSDNYYFSGNCEFTFDFPDYLNVSSESQSKNFDIVFENNTNKSGYIEITTDGASITPSFFYLTGFDDIDSRLSLSNYMTATNINYKIKLSECPEFNYNTVLKKDVVADDSLELLSYSNEINSTDKTINTSVVLRNFSDQDKTFKANLSGFPDSWSYLVSESLNFTNSNNNKVFTIGANEEKILYFRIDTKTLTNNSYNGYFEFFINNSLVLQKPLTIKQISSQLVEYLMSIDVLDDSDNYSKIISINVINNSLKDLNASLVFILEEGMNVLGNNTMFVVSANESLDMQYEIKSNYLFPNNYNLDVGLYDLDTNKQLTNTSVVLNKYDGFFGTGFLTFGVFNSLKWILIVLLVIAFIIYLIYLIIRRRKRKKENKPVKRIFLKKKDVLVKDVEIPKEALYEEEYISRKKLSRSIVNEDKKVSSKDLEDYNSLKKM